MNRLTFAAMLAAALSATAPAHAHWQWTKWGMTPDQVVAASGGAVHAGTSPDVLEGTYNAGGRSYAATFRFAGGRLSQVDLNLAGEVACQSMTLDLANIYGAPDRKNIGQHGIGVGEWLDRPNGNDVVLTYLVQTCKVSYGPLATAASQGL